MNANTHLPEDSVHAPQPKAKKHGTKRKSDGQDSSNAGREPNDKNINENPAFKRSKTSSTKDSKSKEALTDVSNVYLPGEETQAGAPVFATCGDIRRQLTTVLQKPGVSQASFCRTISAASHTHVSPRHLSTFRSKTGKSRGAAAVLGADSPAFYASWVYFEKERVLKGTKKSKHREEMEKAWGGGGMSRRGLQPILAHADTSIEYDKFGRLVLDGVIRQGRDLGKKANL